MSFVTFASFAAAAYLTARPFYKIRRLKIDVEDDLRDYFWGVVEFKQPLLDIMLVLQENGLFDDARRERLYTVYRSLISMESWDDIARADRLVVEAFDEMVGLLKASDLKSQTDRFKKAQERFNTNDEKMIETRRLLHRDIPRLNGSFVHKSKFLTKLLRIPTYPMTEPVQWYEHREPAEPRLHFIYSQLVRTVPPLPCAMPYLVGN
ncbi:hypothetical protein [Rhizobium sp. BK176]|uniref:hypothetical protein n=1 Tax=Rhizobium sp. BK176 TaxID=2587071 RepID=UPI0021694D55|nr:hypothetical protein [Rhizobium sp. BK176]MCS4089333.1 hypothetical protein [Rhizobium sp. BK176]